VKYNKIHISLSLKFITILAVPLVLRRKCCFLDLRIVNNNASYLRRTLIFSSGRKWKKNALFKFEVVRHY